MPRFDPWDYSHRHPRIAAAMAQHLECLVQQAREYGKEAARQYGATAERPSAYGYLLGGIEALVRDLAARPHSAGGPLATAGVEVEAGTTIPGSRTPALRFPSVVDGHEKSLSMGSTMGSSPPRVTQLSMGGLA